MTCINASDVARYLFSEGQTWELRLDDAVPSKLRLAKWFSASTLVMPGMLSKTAHEAVRA
jgi:hypothetical protein